MSGESLRDRLATLSRAELVGLVVLVGVTVGGAGLWYVRSLPKPVTVVASSPSTQAQGGYDAASPSPTPALLLVHVAGWVRPPGVYEFREGDRVIDAVQAAGGPKHGADLNSLNLASPLTDGTQIVVPKRSAPAGSTSSTAPAGSGATTGTSSSPGATVNINTADATALEVLPGIGEVISQRIVDYRTENGPFASVDDLEKVSGIGPSIMGDVRDMETV